MELGRKEFACVACCFERNLNQSEEKTSVTFPNTNYSIGDRHSRQYGIIKGFMFVSSWVLGQREMQHFRWAGYKSCELKCNSKVTWKLCKERSTVLQLTDLKRTVLAPIPVHSRFISQWLLIGCLMSCHSRLNLLWHWHTFQTPVPETKSGICNTEKLALQWGCTGRNYPETWTCQSHCIPLHALESLSD